jgi:hypothetical protein
MQALTVLLLELSQGAVHLEADATVADACVGKLTGWLRDMMPNDDVANRAYRMMQEILGNNERGQQAEDIMDQQHDTKTSEMAWNTDNNPGTQHFDQEIGPNVPFNDNYYRQENGENANLDALSWPLNESFTFYLFGQSQTPLFFGNQYMSNFDQETDSDGGPTFMAK